MSIDTQRPLAEPDSTVEPDLLSVYLRDRDEPCPRCGYNLRGLHTHRCPECGDALRLKVGLVEPRLGAYLATLVAACLGFGGSLLFTVIALRAAPTMWWWDEPSAKALLLTLAVSFVLLVAAVLGRRRFCRLSRAAQRLLALGVWGVVGVLLTTVVVLFQD
ncbi:MAG: hypothetical protein WD534_02825 [Phycisphaeraceae bacterium]